jgi:hypothetical protein
MSALMSDVIEGRIPPGTCHAACNAAGKLLKIAEMQIRYGTRQNGADKDLVLAPQTAGQSRAKTSTQETARS